jgi:hypothetical protein
LVALKYTSHFENDRLNHSFVVDEEHARAASDKREIGVISAAFLVFNRMVGTGIFATPSGILQLSGSVGLALFLWVAGSVIAAAGMAVYLEFGTAIPKNGGEKNYLEFVYKRPKFLATGMYTGYVMLLGESCLLDSIDDHSLTSSQAGLVPIPLSLENTSCMLRMSKSIVGINVASVLLA